MDDPDPFPTGADLPATVRVTSPYPDEPSRPHPRWYERIRGVLGLTGVVVLMGFLLAALIAAALLIFAVVVALSFS